MLVRARLGRWRFTVIGGAIVWLVVIGLWAYRPWVDHVPLATPPGVESQTQPFVCPSALGDDMTRPLAKESAPSLYPIVRTPCTLGKEHRTLAIVNLGLGAIVLLAGVSCFQRRLARTEPSTQTSKVGPGLPLSG